MAKAPYNKRNIRYTLERGFLTDVQTRYRGKGNVQQGPLFKKGWLFYFTKKQ